MQRTNALVVAESHAGVIVGAHSPCPKSGQMKRTMVKDGMSGWTGE
jgi:hypothetical protein